MPLTFYRTFVLFSSRRRHTRCGRDWSSDVCSSDLGEEGVAVGVHDDGHAFFTGTVPLSRTGSFGYRSEERRVGKGCGSRLGLELFKEAVLRSMGPMCRGMRRTRTIRGCCNVGSECG